MAENSHSVIGSHLTKTLSIEVLEHILACVKAGSGDTENGAPSETTRRRPGPKPGFRSGPQKRSRARAIEDQTILDYFKKETASIKTMAEALGITLTMAHKKVKALVAAKALKRVKEGNRVMYMIKPRRNSSGKGNAAASA
jgi:predicted transcriptional regulator